MPCLIGAFRDSRYDVIFGHVQITGCQYSGQHNGHMYGMHVPMHNFLPKIVICDACNWQPHTVETSSVI